MLTRFSCKFIIIYLYEVISIVSLLYDNDVHVYINFTNFEIFSIPYGICT